MISPKKKLLMVGKGGGGIDNLFATTLTSAATGTAIPLKFAPDLDWHKRRSAASDHALLDSRRGAFTLASNTTSAQATASAGYAPDGTRRSTVALGAGTSEVIWSFRRFRKFFDVVTYTGDGTSGRQIAHSLGVKPGLIIVKRANAVSDWPVYHIATGSGVRGRLNSADAFASASEGFPTEPTATAFSVTAGNDLNASGGLYVAYLFAHDPAADGIIRCGSYLGNGSDAGPIINLGWEPQWLLVKNTQSPNGWSIVDGKRSTSNPRANRLSPHQSNAEVSSPAVNFLAQGFQPVTSLGDFNGSSPNNYAYVAIRKGAA